MSKVPGRVDSWPGIESLLRLGGERLLPDVIRIVGADCVMYTSDYPHRDGQYPDSPKAIQEHPTLTENETVGLVGAAARWCYGLAV